MNRMFSAKVWTLIATTGMVLGPAFDVAAQTSSKPRTTKTNASQKTLKSAVQRELEKLYLRDGRTPPKMTSSVALNQLKNTKEAEEQKKKAEAAKAAKKPQSLIQRLFGKKSTTSKATTAQSTTVVKQPEAKKPLAKKKKVDRKPRLLQFGSISRARSLKQAGSNEQPQLKKSSKTNSRSRRRSYATLSARRHSSRIAKKPAAPTAQQMAAAKKPAPSTIRQTAKSVQKPSPAQQSEIQKRLAELYKRDGRQMPPMQLSQLPGTQNAAVPPKPKQQQQKASSSQQKQSTQTASKSRSPISFLKRLLPGRRSTRQTPQQRAVQKRIVRAQSRPKTAAKPTSQVKAVPPKVFTPPTSKKLVVAKKPQLPVVKPGVKIAAQKPKAPTKDSVKQAFTEVSEAEADKANPFSGLTLDDNKTAAKPKQAEPKVAKSQAKPKKIINKLPDFGPAKKPAAIAKAEPKKEEPKKDVKPKIQPKENPFVAQAKKESKPAKKETKPAQKKSKHADKYKKIAQRADKKGLKGFCIVALRDRRELVDSNPQFKFDYNGKIYHFSTSKDQQTFAKNPTAYAPIASGNDVTLLAKTNVEIEGSLDHAVWYKGRLYLFSSKDTLDLFVANPTDYVLFE